MGLSAFLKTSPKLLGIFLFTLLVGLHNFPCAKSCHPSFVMLSTVLHDDENLEGPDSCKDNHVYYNETRKCYLFTNYMRDNPCGPNMKFEQTVENPKIGRCDCDIENRPLFFNQRMKQCYFILTQGPCRRGEWVDLVNGSPKCVHNPCAAINADHNESTTYSSSNSAEAFNVTDSSDQVQVQVQDGELNENIVMFNGNCTLLNSYCKPINSKRTGKVQFTKGEPHPECVLPKFAVKFAVGAIESSRCPHNTYRTIDGRGCQAPVYFDFDF